MRWALPEADESHAEAACHEIEAVGLAEAGALHSSHSKASARAQQHEITDVQPGLTYEVRSSLPMIDGYLQQWLEGQQVF